VAGNTGTAATSANYAVDTKAPTLPTIDLVAGDDTIGAGELTAAVAGAAEAGASVLLTLGLNNVRTVTANGEGRWTYQLTPADLGAMGNGSETLLATAVDAAGNSSAQASRAIQIDLPPPTISSSVDNVPNFDVTSAIVLRASEPVTAVAGKMIRLMNDGGAGFNGESGDNDQSINVGSAAVTIQGNLIIIRPPFDLDLANAYHLEIDSGAFVGASGLSNLAVTDPTALNFSTVTPGTAGSMGTGAAVASQAMDTATGNLVASFSWLDIQGTGSPTGSAVAVDVGTANVALVFKDYDPAGGSNSSDGVGAPDFNVRANNFGAGDLLYIDNQNPAAPNRLDSTTVLAETPEPGITQLSFGFPPEGGLGGLVEIDLAGTNEDFETFEQLALLLDVNYNPVGEWTPPLIT
jgi:hypothetical protein